MKMPRFVADWCRFDSFVSTLGVNWCTDMLSINLCSGITLLVLLESFSIQTFRKDVEMEGARILDGSINTTE